MICFSNVMFYFAASFKGFGESVKKLIRSALFHQSAPYPQVESEILERIRFLDKSKQ